ncbi:Bbi inhibitor [Thalictrum thalictroides]|uniref:Bbi inhibitor n=1 Tax=Thalictrum thalictroides TaxID=46969 RepID=A0A7J6XGN6_THATH|nr:Bbi inhibitor [Thalictrum thalictroides]
MKTSVILFCVVASLVLFSFGFASARFEEIYEQTTQVVHNGDSYESCCDFCVCTRSIPPLCRCTDIKNTCDGCSANSCLCTKSIPPQCRCMDIKNYCAPPCIKMGFKSIE